MLSARRNKRPLPCDAVQPVLQEDDPPAALPLARLFHFDRRKAIVSQLPVALQLMVLDYLPITVGGQNQLAPRSGCFLGNGKGVGFYWNYKFHGSTYVLEDKYRYYL